MTNQRFRGREMLIELARSGISLHGGADDPAASKSADDAKKRADAAEAETQKLRDEAKRRADIDAQAKLDNETRDLDGAKRAAKDAADRAQKAEDEAKSLREMLEKQTDAKLDGLKPEDKDRVKKWKTKLNLSDYDQLVTEELAKMRGGTTVTTTSDGKPVPPPPAAGATTTSISDTRGQGRELNPKSTEVLKKIGVDPGPARRLIDVTREENSTKFEMPADVVVDFLKARPLYPALLSPENYEKLTTRKR